LQGLIQAHIQVMGRPLQPEYGSFLPLPIERAPDIKVARRADAEEKNRYRQDQEDYQALL
jgi:hypothetical protein